MSLQGLCKEDLCISLILICCPLLITPLKYLNNQFPISSIKKLLLFIHHTELCEELRGRETVYEYSNGFSVETFLAPWRRRVVVCVCVSICFSIKL